MKKTNLLDILNKVEENHIPKKVPSQPNKELRETINPSNFFNELKETTPVISKTFKPSLTKEETLKAKSMINLELKELNKILTDNELFLQRVDIYEKIPELNKKFEEMKDIIAEYKNLLVTEDEYSNLIKATANYEAERDIFKENIYIDYI